MIYLAWRNLFRNSHRTLASVLTVAFGASGLLIFQGFNEGIMNQYRDNTIRVRYGNGQVFPKGYREKKLEEPWRAWLENPEVVEKELLALPHIQKVFPRVTFFAFLTKGGVNLAGRGEGVRSKDEAQFFSAMNFVEGTDLGVKGDAKAGVILGKGLADSLGIHPGENLTILAQTVNGQLNGLALTVTGIFHTGAKEFDDSYFRIELETAQALLDTKRVELFSLATDSIETWAAVEESIRTAIPAVEAIPFDELDKVYYKNAVAFLDSQFSVVRLIMLLIVALGIFNTVASGLLERSGEVGALRANGESRLRVFQVLSTESALLGLLGGVAGVVFAVVLDQTLLAKGIAMPPGPGITRQFLIFLEIQPGHFAQALILPALTTLIASLWPIRRLVKASIPSLLRQNL